MLLKRVEQSVVMKHGEESLWKNTNNVGGRENSQRQLWRDWERRGYSLHAM